MPVLPCQVTYTGTTTTTKPLFRAVRSGKLIRASYSQELNTAGATVTAKIRNATQAVDMTAALDVNGKGALYGAEFAVNADSTADYLVGDLIVIVLTFGTGTLGPGECPVALDTNYGTQNNMGFGG